MQETYQFLEVLLSSGHTFPYLAARIFVEWSGYDIETDCDVVSGSLQFFKRVLKLRRSFIHEGGPSVVLLLLLKLSRTGSFCNATF